MLHLKSKVIFVTQMNYVRKINQFKQPDEKLRYVGPQTFYNARAVNARERYYYGYYGLNYGPQSSISPMSDYKVLRPSPLPCDALSEDCWSQPKFPGVPACDGCAEGFSSGGSNGTFLIIGAALALLAYYGMCKK